MKKSKVYLMSGFLGLVVTTLLVSSLASASELGQKFVNRNIDPARQEEMQAKHEEMQQVLENGDYQGWLEIVNSRPRITDYINEDNFDQFVEMHNYMQEGDFESAEQIREELGLPDKGKGFHKGFRMGHKHCGQNLEE